MTAMAAAAHTPIVILGIPESQAAHTRKRRRKATTRAVAMRPALLATGLDEPVLALRPERHDGPDELVLFQDALRRVDRARHLDLPGAAVASLADDARGEDAEHVELRDEVRDATLRQDVGAGGLAELLVDVEDLTGRERVHALVAVELLAEDRREKDELALRGERAHDLADAVELDLVLRHADVGLHDLRRAVALAQFRGHAQQVEGAAGVAVLARREGGAQGDDGVVDDAVLEGHAGALLQDVLELGG